MEECTINSKTIYQGKIINLRLDEVKLPNGKKTQREVVEHPGAVAVLPLLENGEVIVVKQFRKPVEKILYEIPAGKLEKGEDPLLCAQRELLEETGLEAKEMKKICEFYTTPGFSDEIMHIFLAKDLIIRQQQLDDDEFLQVEKLSLTKLGEMVARGQIKDAKTLIGLLWVFNNKDEI